MPLFRKKHGYSVSIGRLFTRPGLEASNEIPTCQSYIDGLSPDIEYEFPDHWSLISAELFFSHGADHLPNKAKPFEENTVPSWLWCRQKTLGSVRRENAVNQVFDRLIGSAAYKGWKLGMFREESDARSFYEELRFAFTQRSIAIEPELLHPLGLEWAYGTTGDKPPAKSLPAERTIVLSNSVIDAIVCGRRDKASRAQWQKIESLRREKIEATISFADLVQDWGETPIDAPVACIDVMSCRHNDGTLNVQALAHLTRLLVFLLDLHEINSGSASLTLMNLASLSMALGQTYDSEESRAFVAATIALVTANALSASAELASLKGPSADFAKQRDVVSRKLRNQRRSVYGEHTDFEKISVVPESLSLEVCPDLAVAAAARQAWDDALQLAQNYGLRQTEVTNFTPSRSLKQFTESLSEGVAPIDALTVGELLHDEGCDVGLAPAAKEALMRFDLKNSQLRELEEYALGTRTLKHAPELNWDVLKHKGFGTEQISNLENYIADAKDLRFVFTPWVVGVDFCKRVLKVPANDLERPRFDLLKFLGFSSRNVDIANLHCFGHRSLAGAPHITQRQRSIFVTELDTSPESKIKMAAAAQSFVSGGIGLSVSLSEGVAEEKLDALIMLAWRGGVRNLQIDCSGFEPRRKRAGMSSETIAKRQRVKSGDRSPFIHAKSPALPVRKSKSGAQSSAARVARPRAKASRRNWTG